MLNRVNTVCAQILVCLVSTSFLSSPFFRHYLWLSVRWIPLFKKDTSLPFFSHFLWLLGGYPLKRTPRVGPFCSSVTVYKVAISLSRTRGAVQPFFVAVCYRSFHYKFIQSSCNVLKKNEEYSPSLFFLFTRKLFKVIKICVQFHCLSSYGNDRLPALEGIDAYLRRWPVISPTSRFANVPIANVFSRFA